MATYRDEHAQPERSGWSRTRWLLVLGLIAAVVIAIVLVVVFAGGGSGGGGGGY